MISSKHLLELRKYPNSLYHQLKVEFIFHSNRMEGSTFTEEQLGMLLDKGIVVGEHKLEDIKETSNSLEVFEEMVNTFNDPITEDLLLKLHSILKKGTKDEEAGLSGVWKIYDNKILGVPVKLTPPLLVRERIKDLIYRWEISTKSLSDIAKFHVDFEQIHPFQDGNGRIGRFIMLKQCLENGVVPIVVDSEYSAEYKRELGNSQITGDTTSFIEVLERCQTRFMQKEIVLNTIQTLKDKGL
jgi:Fic family protein